MRNPEIRATGRVLVPPPAARFGVISDIDDTIVYSNVLSKWRMIVSLAFSNARTRKPFKGVGAFYRALHLRMNRSHKTEAIEAILQTYPALGFILIGDSGEQDPEIYAQIVRRHPQRIRAIYIRSVDPNPSRPPSWPTCAPTRKPTSRGRS